MDIKKQRPGETGFFDLPAELRIMVYSALRDLSRQDRRVPSDGPGRHRTNSYSNVLCPSEFKTSQESDRESSPTTPTRLCPVYQQFLATKLISKQFRQEYTPIWYHGWTFQIPRPTKTSEDAFYATENDCPDLSQLSKFLQVAGELGTSSLRHVRLTYRLGAQKLPELSVAAMPVDKLRDLLHQASRGYLLNSKLVVHIEVQCSVQRPSNRRAVKEVLFGRDGQGWHCICESGVVVSYDRSWN